MKKQNKKTRTSIGLGDDISKVTREALRTLGNIYNIKSVSNIYFIKSILVDLL